MSGPHLFCVVEFVALRRVAPRPAAQGLPESWAGSASYSAAERGGVVAARQPLPLNRCFGEERESERAFSLIEMIGVLTVIAVLALALAPSFVRPMDKAAADQESAALKSFGEALQQGIMRNRYIPSATDWATNIAAESGADIATVTTSPRKQPRIFLVDPNLSIAGGGLPYTQTSAGAATFPASPRVMILSSIGPALPGGLVSGTPSAADFTNIWNSADGTVPAAPAFAGWTGAGSDLRVHRVDFSPLFVQLQLTKAPSSSCFPYCPRYSIDANNWGTAITVTNTASDWPGYFIQNSVLYLYNNDQSLDSQQILIRNNTFVYDQNVWRGSIGGEGFLAGLDIASVVDRYLAAYPNRQAQNGTNQQVVVVQSMISFMDRYNDWAAAGFPTNPAPTYAAVQSAQVAMKNAVQGQYIANSYNPTQVNCQ